MVGSKSKALVTQTIRLALGLDPPDSIYSSLFCQVGTLSIKSLFIDADEQGWVIKCYCYSPGVRVQSSSMRRLLEAATATPSRPEFVETKIKPAQTYEDLPLCADLAWQIFPSLGWRWLDRIAPWVLQGLDLVLNLSLPAVSGSAVVGLSFDTAAGQGAVQSCRRRH